MITRSLVELGNPGSQIGRVPLLSGHFFQTARDLSHGLGPAGRRIGHQSNTIAHVPKILGNGDPRIDRSLPCSHRHVRRVGDQHGSLHKSLTGPGVFELGKLHQHVGHFVPTLATAHIDDDVRVGPFGELMLDHGLPTAKRAGNAGCTALAHREKRVNHTLSRCEGLVGHEFFPVRS